MLNISSKIQNSLSSSALAAIKDVADAKGNSKCYLVGGVVRDLILEREIFDIDMIVEGDAVEFAQLIEKKTTAKITQIQPELRTAKVVFNNGTEIDFASTRTENYPQKGHLPVLKETGCSLEDDIKRRDFTINALAASLNNEDFGDIKDFVNGLEDLKKKQLRILHKDSFIDDPTRIIRGLKFSVRFGFELEEKTKTLQDNYLADPNFDISYTRLKSELIQTFSLPYPQVWEKFMSQKIYRLINPDFDMEINSFKAVELIKKHKPAHDWLVFLAPVFIRSASIELMNFTKQEKKIITDLEKIINRTPPSTNIGVYKFFNGIEKASIITYFLITNNIQALTFIDQISSTKLEITGEDIKNAGMPPSSVYSEIFDAVLDEKLSGNLASRNDELEFLKFLIKELKK